MYSQEVGTDGESTMRVQNSCLSPFGIHPHVASHGVTRSQLDQLDSLLVESKCVAVGEIGIDHTTRCRCDPMCKNENECRGRMARNQEEALIGMLFLARDRNLPVVLHCRDKTMELDRLPAKHCK